MGHVLVSKIMLTSDLRQMSHAFFPPKLFLILNEIEQALHLIRVIGISITHSASPGLNELNPIVAS